MSIQGTIVLEDVTITFSCTSDLRAIVAICEVQPDGSVLRESYTCAQYDFLAALSIAVHNDGLPQYETDYPAAARGIRELRWIP